ncbi:MAG: DUF4270 family protein [Bacteroidales bacterium]
MTIKNILRSTVVIALTAFFLTSCIETDKTTGSSLIPSDHILKVNTIGFDLPVQMKLSDSLQTVYSGALIIGSNKDPDLGTMQASAAFQFIPASSKHDFGESPLATSFKMYITVENKTFFREEDRFIPQNFNVYRLTKDLDSTVKYNNSLTDSDYLPQPLNSSGNVFFGGDTLVMDISLDYAQELVTATEEERDSLALFHKKFKGLYMTASTQPGSLEGGRINSLSPSSIYFLMTYRHLDSKNNIDKDSLIAYYVIDEGIHINRFEHSSKNLESTNPQDQIFMEGFAGVKPFIDFNQVKNNITDWAVQNNTDLNKFIIAKAEIRLPFEYPIDYIELNYYPSQLFICTRESLGSSVNKTIMYDPIADLSYLASNGSINRSLKYYSLDITSYLQKVLKGEYTGRSLEGYIAPVFESSDYYTGATSYYIQTALYSKATLNGNGAANHPRLLLTYSIMP